MFVRIDMSKYKNIENRQNSTIILLLIYYTIYSAFTAYI